MSRWLIFGCVFVGACGSEPPAIEAGCQEAATGAVECIDTNDCGLRLEGWLEHMDGPEMPRSDRPELTITSSDCIFTHVTFDGRSVSGNACKCELSVGGGHLLVGPRGVGCFSFDRVRHCLWDDSEILDCGIEPDSLCEEYCDRMLEQRKQTQLQLFETTLLHFECTEDRRCASVARIDDQCFVNQQWFGPAPCDLESLTQSDPPEPDSIPNDAQGRCTVAP